MDLRHAFTAHPASVGESYTQHLRMASGFALRMFAAGAACLVHALFPFLFERTGSRCISELHHRMVVARSAARRTVAAEGGTRPAPTPLSAQG